MKQGWRAVALAVLSFGLGGGVVAAIYSGRNTASAPAQLFGDVLTTIHDHYIDSTAETVLYDRATRGLVTSLHDPYAELLVGDGYREYREQMSGMRSEDGSPGGGRGHSGRPTPIVSGGVARTMVHIPAVSSSTLLDGGVAYVALHAITRSSAAELRDAIAELRGRGMTSLVLDLRLNPGGLINEGIRVAELFLDPPDTITATQGRRPEHSKTYVAQSPQPWPDLPLVLLVNRGTASSAEMIAAALQDHDRAAIIGTPTFGKGVVQTTFPLGDDVALKLSTARWYAPSGRSVGRSRATPAPPGDASAVPAPVPGPSGPFRSSGGRLLPANSGIVPDLVTRNAPLADSERQLLRALGSDMSLFRDVLTSYARDLRGTGQIINERFSVTPAMRGNVRQRLQREGLRLSGETVEGAARFVDQELGYAIARELFGESAEVRRRVRDDRQLQIAVALIRRSHTPRDVIAITSARQAEVSGD